MEICAATHLRNKVKRNTGKGTPVKPMLMRGTCLGECFYYIKIYQKQKWSSKNKKIAYTY